MTCPGKHPPATLKAAWWTWACKECDPELYKALTRPEKNGPSSRCPFCLQVRSLTRDGLYRQHGDIGEKCRASGLSRSASLLAFQALVKGKDVEWFLGLVRAGTKPPPLAGEEAPKKVLVEPDPCFDWISELVHLRKASKMPVSYLAKYLGTTENSLRRYELMEQSPPLWIALLWMDLFRKGIVLANTEERVNIYDWRDFSNAMRAARLKQNYSFIQLQQMLPKLTVNGSNTLHSRENGAAENMRLAAAIEWAAALGYSTEMEDR